MFDRDKLEHVIDLQQRSYRLLKWLAGAVSDGLIRFESAHAFTTLPDVTSSWLSKHLQNVPPEARPDQADVPAFARFFATYLENSFDLDVDPGKRLYSPDAHCFCPLCSWLIDAPNLKTKKVRASDKKRANHMRIDAVQGVALDLGLSVSDADVEQLLEDRLTYENASLLAYGFDLLRRINGISNGPAVLALWRGFAWNRSGSPKSNFQLTSDLIINAEAEVVRTLSHHGGANGRPR